MNINYKDWEIVFRKDMKDKLFESKREFDKYKSSKNVVYLQQAGNKLFSVVENFIMLKYKTRVGNYQDLRKLVVHNKFDRLLLSKVAQLHYFYYENIIRGEPQEFEDIYLDVYGIMKRRA